MHTHIHTHIYVCVSYIYIYIYIYIEGGPVRIYENYDNINTIY